MATALVGLGSNLGDRAAALVRAVELLRGDAQIRVEAVSGFRPSKPAGGPAGQGEFLNACARLETSLAPEELLARLLAIEDNVGRVREERWGPRVIDLDLLLYDRVEMKTPTLELPHPRMCYRRFVLEPAAEIAGEMVWPVNGWSVGKLRDNLNTTARYLAISKSTIPPVREFLAAIQSETGCRLILEPENRVCHPLGASRLSAPEIEIANWPHDSLWAISDFWFDRTCLDIEWLYDLESEGAKIAMRRWEELRTRVVQPRLVFVLEDPARWWSLANQLGSTFQTEFILHDERSLAAARDKYYWKQWLFSRRPDSPPTMWLPSDDLEAFQREVLAAMQAME